MRVTTSKSKNSESFYITKSYTNAQGSQHLNQKIPSLSTLQNPIQTLREKVLLPQSKN